MKSSLWVIGIGLFIWLINIGIFSFWQWGRDWPWILIIIGLSGLIKNLHSKNRKEQNRADTEKEFKVNVRDILEKVEQGELSAEDAVKGIREEE